MGIFSSILETVGLADKEAPVIETMPYNPKPAAIVSEVPVPAPAPAPAVAPAPEVKNEPVQAVAPPETMASVDVLAKLEDLAENSAEKLNWRISIVDLLKLLKLDSSLTARKALAIELNCPESLMADSAQMNMWLHKTVLQQIAAYGGNVPPELLD